MAVLQMCGQVDQAALRGSTRPRTRVRPRPNPPPHCRGGNRKRKQIQIVLACGLRLARVALIPSAVQVSSVFHCDLRVSARVTLRTFPPVPSPVYGGRLGRGQTGARRNSSAVACRVNRFAHVDVAANANLPPPYPPPRCGGGNRKRKTDSERRVLVR